MKNYFLILVFVFSSNVISQNVFLDFVFNIKKLNNNDYYTRDKLDHIIINDQYVHSGDSFSIYCYSKSNYIEDKYLRIYNYMLSGQATFSIEEFKRINFKNKSYILYSQIYGLKGYTSYHNNNIQVYQIKNNILKIDEKLKSKLERFMNYKYFTDNKNLIKSSNKSSFVYNFEGDENEISIEINEPDMKFEKIFPELKGDVLKIIFLKNKIKIQLKEIDLRDFNFQND